MNVLYTRSTGAGLTYDIEADKHGSGDPEFFKRLIARSLKVQNVVLKSPDPPVARPYSFGLRQPKTRIFEVLEQPVPSSQFHNEGAHTNPLGSAVSTNAMRKNHAANVEHYPQPQPQPQPHPQPSRV